MVQQSVNTCGTLAATCTLGAYLLDKLPIIAAVLSIIWLTLNITYFVWLRIKEWWKK
jgi:hypothetical protein